MHITRLRRAGIVATLLGVLLTLLPGVTAGASTPTTTATASGDPQIMVVCHRTYYGRVGQSYIARNDCLAPGAYLETGWYEHQGRWQQQTLTFQSDGNLVLYRWIQGQGFGTAIWATNTNGHNVGFASLQEDGNFVLYNAVGQPYWSTGTWNCPGSWDTKQLEMQLDENLVLYFWPTNGGPRSAKWDRWGIARCR